MSDLNFPRHPHIEFPPFGECAAGCISSGADHEPPSSFLRVALLDGEPLPLTERFLLLCSRPMHELAYLLKTALAAQAAKAEGVWAGVGGPGGGHTPVKKVRPYRIAAPASSRWGAGLHAVSGAGGSSNSTTSALFSPGSASLRKIKPKVISQPQQDSPGAGSVPGMLGGGGSGGLQFSSSSGGASSSGSGSGSLTGLLSRLEAAYFQQHPHLHRCTELVLQATLKNGRALARDRCVAPAVQVAVGRMQQQGCVPPVVVWYQSCGAFL